MMNLEPADTMVAFGYLRCIRPIHTRVERHDYTGLPRSLYRTPLGMPALYFPWKIRLYSDTKFRKLHRPKTNFEPKEYQWTSLDYVCSSAYVLRAVPRKNAIIYGIPNGVFLSNVLQCKHPGAAYHTLHGSTVRTV